MQDILEFLPAGGLRQRADIIAVDSSRLLPRLRALCPYARITAVTRLEEVPELPALQNLDIEWHVIDQRREKLPFEEESFDYVLAEEALTTCYEAVLEALKLGEFSYRAEHLWAKAEVVRLMDDTLFKEVSFMPGEQDGERFEEEWEALGFDNFSRDLAASLWLVKAGRSTATVANLKSFYSPEVRKKISRLLHRLEYGIEVEAGLSELAALCLEQQIFQEYLEDFIDEACKNKKKVFSLLSGRNFFNNL